MTYYPKHVYDARENVTRANMKRYDELYKKFNDELYSIPNYKELSFIEQMKIRDELRKKDIYSYL